MKKLLPLLLLFACKDQQIEPLVSGSKDEQTTEIGRISRSLLYFKDHRTGLCFALTFIRRGMGAAVYGGPAMASVDCEKVGTLLLNGVESSKL